MKAVVTRVRHASVHVDGALVGAIGHGLLVLLGVTHTDGPADVAWMAQKVASLRIFDDENAQMGRSVHDVGGGILLVSQFTLLADTRKGRRPSFTQAARPEVAAPLIEAVADALTASGLQVAQGRFGAHMLVDSQNDGPVTLLLDSQAKA